MKQPVKVMDLPDLDYDALKTYAVRGCYCTFTFGDMTYEGTLREDEGYQVFYVKDCVDFPEKSENIRVDIPDGAVIRIHNLVSHASRTGVVSIDDEYRPKKPRKKGPVGRSIYLPNEPNDSIRVWDESTSPG